MRYGESRASALWGKGEGRWRRAIVCLTAVAALSAPASALAVPKADVPPAPTVDPVVEVVAPVAGTEPVFEWLANWTW